MYIVYGGHERTMFGVQSVGTLICVHFARGLLMACVFHAWYFTLSSQHEIVT